MRLGADGRVPCPLATEALQRIVLRLPQDEPFALYNNGDNFNNDKYVLSANFLTVTVRDMTVSDEGEYSCEVTHGDSFPGRLIFATPVTISVYGES